MPTSVSITGFFALNIYYEPFVVSTGNTTNVFMGKDYVPTEENVDDIQKIKDISG